MNKKQTQNQEFNIESKSKLQENITQNENFKQNQKNDKSKYIIENEISFKLNSQEYETLNEKDDDYKNISPTYKSDTNINSSDERQMINVKDTGEDDYKQLNDQDFEQLNQYFTIESAFNQIGGFGKLQILATILIGFIRNYGMHQIYGFAISIFETPAYLCQDDQNWVECSKQYICEQLKNEVDIQYKADESNQEFLKNWYYSMDLMCLEKSQYTQIGSSYFVGYFVGSIFFFMPDQVGRKGTMNRIMPLYIASSYFSLFSQSIPLKMFGFFMQGFFHIKTSLSYQHIFELVPQNKKVVCSTFLSSMDCATILTICFSLKFLTKELDKIFHFIYYIQTLGILIYLILIPESPYWQFSMYGKKSIKGIDTLNYISWFNGSAVRIPYSARFDIIGQVVNDSKSINDISKVEKAKISINNSISNSILINHNNKNKKNKSIFKEVIEIYGTRKYCKNHCLLSILWGSLQIIYFLALYNSAELKGNVLTLGIMFGLSECLGIIGGERCLQLFPDHICFYFSMAITMIASVLIKLPGISDYETYILLILQVFFVGLIYGVMILVQESRTPLRLQAVSLELNLCISYIISAFTPQIAKMNEPYPLLTFILCGSICLIVMCYLGPSKQNDEDDDFIQDIEKSIISLSNIDENQKSQCQNNSRFNKNSYSQEKQLDQMIKWKINNDQQYETNFKDLN